MFIYFYICVPLNYLRFLYLLLIHRHHATDDQERDLMSNLNEHYKRDNFIYRIMNFKRKVGVLKGNGEVSIKYIFKKKDYLNFLKRNIKNARN